MIWIIFSPKCILCGVENFNDNSLCGECWSKLYFINSKFCNTCAIPKFNDYCDCCKSGKYYTQIISTLVYEENCAKIIRQFKYNDSLQLRKFMGKLMINSSKKILCKIDLITPVPLHKEKLRYRKYNQSLLLAKEIKAKEQVLISDLIIKCKNNRAQNSLSYEMRISNIRGNFKLNSRFKALVKDKNILLVDDVITTGSTVNECAKILIESGVKTVYAISFARTIKI